MSHALALRDHGAVQSAVVRTTVAGAAAGLVHALAPGALTDAFALCAIGLAPALGWLAAGGAAGLCAGLGVVGREVEWQAALPEAADAVPSLPAAGDGSPVAGAWVTRGRLSTVTAEPMAGEGGELGELLG